MFYLKSQVARSPLSWPEMMVSSSLPQSIDVALGALVRGIRKIGSLSFNVESTVLTSTTKISDG